MRPRYDTIIHGDHTTVIDMTSDISLDVAKAESKADVRTMMWRKIAAIDPALAGTDRLLLVTLRYIILSDKQLNAALQPDERVAMQAAGAALVRIATLQRAVEDIEAEIDGLATAVAVFEHNEGLAANRHWPE